MTYKPPEPPPGTLSVLQHEADLVALATLLERKSREVLESDARMGLGTAKELALAAIRARKQASELALSREQRDFDVYLVEHEKRMRGLVPSATRAPLRRKDRS